MRQHRACGTTRPRLCVPYHWHSKALGGAMQVCPPAPPPPPRALRPGVVPITCTLCTFKEREVRRTSLSVIPRRAGGGRAGTSGPLTQPHVPTEAPSQPSSTCGGAGGTWPAWGEWLHRAGAVVLSGNAPYRSMHPVHVFCTPVPLICSQIPLNWVSGFLAQPQYKHRVRTVSVTPPWSLQQDMPLNVPAMCSRNALTVPQWNARSLLRPSSDNVYIFT